MIVIGTKIDTNKIKVDGMFVDGSIVTTITAITPPSEPASQPGKDKVLYLDTTTNTLNWEYVDRPLNELETVEQQNAQMLLALVQGGLM